ncbi:MAG: GNAT family N-acetyltransferase [Salinigranum sp.]
MRITSPGMDDVDAIADLWVELAAGQRAHGSHLLAAENRTTIRESIAHHVAVDGVRVARDPDIVGFVTFDFEGNDYDQTATRGVVRNLYVRGDRRNEGIGRALLTAAERELAAAGADVVSLEALAGNEAAIRFYERAGYRTHRVELEKPVENDTHSKEDR